MTFHNMGNGAIQSIKYALNCFSKDQDPMSRHRSAEYFGLNSVFILSPPSELRKGALDRNSFPSQLAALVIHHTIEFLPRSMFAENEESYSAEGIGSIEHFARLLSDHRGNHRGQTILTAVYLSVFSLCFLTPIVYYCRIQYEERQARRLRDLEAFGLSVALQQSQINNRDESRAVRRKYIEERRARIVQLFAPVRMILTENNFLDWPLKKSPLPANADQIGKMADMEEGRTSVSSELAQSCETRDEADESTHIETEESNEDNDPVKAIAPAPPSATSESSTIDDLDDDASMIRIPVAGLHLSGDEPRTRLAPAVCTICLCPYKVGSDIVWSSNSACDHVFHENCIEKWLMKQREGPLCPCCRRDFIVDPYDLEDNDVERQEQETHASPTATISTTRWDGPEATDLESENSD